MAHLPDSVQPAMEQPAKKKGSKNPLGIFGDPPKLQVRLLGFKVEGKAFQKPIPGTFKDVPAAEAAQAEAKQKLDAGGPEAVWPNWGAPSARNARGAVRRFAHQCSLALRSPQSLLLHAGLETQAGDGGEAGQRHLDQEVERRCAAIQKVEGLGRSQAQGRERPLRGQWRQAT